jgi:hypothetical protein
VLAGFAVSGGLLAAVLASVGGAGLLVACAGLLSPAARAGTGASAGDWGAASSAFFGDLATFGSPGKRFM